MTPQISLPASYDFEYLIKKSNARHFDAPINDPETGDVLFRFQPYRDDQAGIDVSFDSVMAVVEAYPTTYLAEVLGPRLLREASVERDRKLAAFNVNGFAIPLHDRETRADLTGTVAGLERRPNRTHVSWSLGEGHFKRVTRDEALAIGDAAFDFVQDCFAAHEAIAAEIKAAETIHDLDGFDIANHEAWPA